MLARIAELNEGLKQVSDNIAHDLKTPLTRLRNRAEAALAGDADAADYREALEGDDRRIRPADPHLQRDPDDLAAGGRLFAPRRFAKVDLAAIVARRGRALRAGRRGGGRRSLEAPTSRLVGDRRQPRADRPGAVQPRRQRDQILAPSADDGRRSSRRASSGRAARSRLSVSDNGPGIPDEDDRERATERFVRLEQSRSQPGSGLGLSLAKAVMKFHGGRLELLPGSPGLTVGHGLSRSARADE